jgi:hypothetical protein
MAGNDGASEFRVVRRGGMMRRQRLRPGTKDDEQRNQHPGRDDHAPSREKPIVALRLGLGFDTFQHAITRFLLQCNNWGGHGLATGGSRHVCHAVHIAVRAGTLTSGGHQSRRTSSLALARLTRVECARVQESDGMMFVVIADEVVLVDDLGAQYPAIHSRISRGLLVCRTTCESLIGEAFVKLGRAVYRNQPTLLGGRA